MILEIIESFLDIHREIANLLSNKEYVTACHLLEECQQNAIELGMALEKSEGEKCITVRHIEEYCKSVFCLHEKAIESVDYDMTDMLMTLDMSFLKIKESFVRDIRRKKEIVFLPYNREANYDSKCIDLTQGMG